jgi:hypothetical protein
MGAGTDIARSFASGLQTERAYRHPLRLPKLTVTIEGFCGELFLGEFILNLIRQFAYVSGFSKVLDLLCRRFDVETSMFAKFV